MAYSSLPSNFLGSYACPAHGEPPHSREELIQALRVLHDSFASETQRETASFHKFNNEYIKCVEEYPTFEELDAQIANLSRFKSQLIANRPKYFFYLNWGIILGSLYFMYDSIAFFEFASYGSIFLMRGIIQVALSLFVLLGWLFLRSHSHSADYKTVTESLSHAEATRDLFKKDHVNPEAIRNEAFESLSSSMAQEIRSLRSAFFERLAPLNFLSPDFQNVHACSRLISFLSGFQADSFAGACQLYIDEVNRQKQMNLLHREMDAAVKKAYSDGHQAGYSSGLYDGRFRY